MARRFIIWILVLGFHLNDNFAQEWLGYQTSNYAGIHAVQYNPALITQTNYGKLDISIIAANAHVENNYVFLNSITITDPVNTFSDPNFSDRYIRLNGDINNRSAIVHANVQSPAFLYQFTNRDAIGFCVRPRVFVNADNVDRPLARLIYEGLDYPLYWNGLYRNDYLNVGVNAFVEYDFTYARALYVNDRYRFKGGLTFKLLQGIAAGGIGLRDYQYNFYNNDTLGYFNASALYGMNDHLYNQEFAFDFNAPGVAFDIGFTLEYIPNKKTKRGLYRKRSAKNVKWPGIFAPDETRYKYKFGVSANDLGAIFYQRTPETRDFTANITELPLTVFDGVGSIADVNAVIQQNFNMNGTDGDLTWIMPAHVNIFGDVRFRHNLGLHTSLTLAFNNGRVTPFKSHYLHQLIVTPRWEIKWFGVYLPIWVSQYMNAPNLGISLRLGPLVIGTGDILGHLIKREYADIDVHMALRLVIPHKKKGSGNNVMNGGKSKGKGKHDQGGKTNSCEDFKPVKSK